MEFVNIHASCVVLADSARAFGAPQDAGILLLGPSGSGKSDFALRMIERGAELVADDRVELYVQAGELWARPPARLAGLIEVRGVGIVSLPHRPAIGLSLVIELVDSAAVPRLPEREVFVPPENLAVAEAARPPLLKVSALECSAPAKMLAAAAAFAKARFGDDRNPL